MEGIPGRTPAQTAGSRQGSQEVTEQARQQTGQLARQARQQTTEFANRGSEQIKSQLANQKHQAAQRMTPLQSSALRETGQQLRNQGQGSVAQYADKSADQLEHFSRYLRENEVDQILDEARGFARRRPGLYVGSALALGFLASRFLKSSSQEEGASAGAGSSEETPSATSRAVVSHGTTGEPASALPPGDVEGGSPTVRRTPAAGQPRSDREKAHAEELPGEPTDSLENFLREGEDRPPTRGSSSSS